MSGNDRLHGDGAVYNPASGRWRTVQGSPLSPRADPASVWTGREVIVFGGWARGHWLTEGATYDPASDTWQRMPAPPIPLPVGPEQLLWTGTSVVVLGFTKDFASVSAEQFTPAANTWQALPPIPIAHPWQYGAVSAAMIASRLVVWVSAAGSYTLNRPGTAWHRSALSPRAAGCVSDVIWTGRSILFPPSFYSISCGGDAGFHPGTRGVQLVLRSHQIRRMTYSKAGDTWGDYAWTGAALLTFNGAGFQDGEDIARPGMTAAWNPRADTWTALPRAPGVDDTATWTWTGSELIGVGQFQNARQQQVATGLVLTQN